MMPAFFSATLAEPSTSPDPNELAFAVNRRLGRGINLGNIFDAPEEGAWGLHYQDAFPKLIRDAGFDAVRLPVRWSTHAQPQAPYTIDPVFLRRIDQIVRQCLDLDLAVVLNCHHYEEIHRDPAAHRQRLIAIWDQLARYFADKPQTLLFELLNEPHDRLTAPIWNALIADLLPVIRRSNPTRCVIVGPVAFNNLSELPSLQLPDHDRYLIVTIHYYNPFRFTHQGASWVGPRAQNWLGTRWTGSPEDQAAVEADFQKIARWAEEHRRPIYIGEFGAYSRADLDSRVRWTRFVRQQAEKHGFSWAYWEFASGFGIYNPATGTWNRALLDSLIPSTSANPAP